VLTILADYDLATPDARKQAYDKVIDTFVGEYGEKVLATPRSKFPWLLPVLASVGALTLLIVVGRRWVRSSATTAASTGTGAGAAAGATPSAADEAYADKLDDELAETD